jgi:hypothetical protein
MILAALGPFLTQSPALRFFSLAVIYLRPAMQSARVKRYWQDGKEDALA